jgi:hypothetical protein
MLRKTCYLLWIIGLLLFCIISSASSIFAAQDDKVTHRIEQPRTTTVVPYLHTTSSPQISHLYEQLPDLIIESLTLTPANPGAGGSADIEVVVKNQGTATANATFTLYLYVEPDDRPPTQSTPFTTFATYAIPLPAGSTFRYTRTGQVFNETPAVVYAWVDPPWENSVVESNEDNNLFPSVTSAPDSYEDDDTCINAKEITPDGTVQARNLYRDPDSDIDWIKFNGTSGVTYAAEAIAVGADASPTLGLYDHCDGTPSFGNSAKIEFTAPADGIFFIKVFSNEANYGPDNDYQFKITNDSDCTNYFEPNNTCAGSGDLPLDSIQTHTFCEAQDVDWTRFPVTAGTKYKLISSNVGSKADVKLSLYMSCNDANDTASGQSFEFTAPEAGYIFLKAEQLNQTVYGADTDYTIKAERLGAEGCIEDAFEQDDSAADPTLIDTDGTLQEHNICPADDDDWVKFSAFAGVTYNIETLNLASAADTMICLQTSSGDELMCDDDSGAGKGSRLIFTPPLSGDYLLHIKDISATVAGDETKYDLRISQGVCEGDNFEMDDSRDEAKVVDPGLTITSHNFCPAGDQDWAGFYATSGTSYVIETTKLGPEADTVIELYTATGSLLAQNDDNSPGTSSQVAFTANTSGTYFVRVHQYNPSYQGAGTEYGVRIRIGTPTPTPTTTLTPTPTATATPNPSEVRTLILVNRSRLAQLYSEEEADQVMNKLMELAQNQQVRGEIIRLDNNAEVSTAYSIWISDLSNIQKANQVTTMIRNLVMTYLQQRAGIEYLLLVGDDRVLPMRRILDTTPRSSESSYTHTDVNNPTGAAIRGNYFLTDDYFSDREPTILESHELFIPDLATGRLIETPSEIINQIDAFLAKPLTVVNKILVTGYDFVQDVATEDCTDWGSEFGEDNTDCSLIGSTWTSTDFRALQLNSSDPFLIQSISGHAAHYAEGAPVGTSIQAQEIADVTIDLSGGLIYSVGCHGGLNVPPNNPESPIDLPQAFVSKQANYVGNTGYGWGMRNAIGLSEKVIRLFTRALLTGTKSSMGKALATAKSLYYQQDQDFTSYDEKVMQQVVFYGLPMYELETGAALGDPGNDFPGVGFEPELPTGQLGDTGVVTGSVSINFTEAQNLTLSETSNGDYYALNGSIHIVPGQPMQPLHFGDVTVPQLPARGVLLLNASYEAQGAFDPVVASPYNEYATDNIEPDLVDPLAIYPAVPVTIQEYNDTCNLVTQLGQYDALSEDLFLLQEVQLELYYSLSDDHLPPKTTVIDSITPLGSGVVEIKVGAVDESGIERVVVSYIDDINQTIRQLRSIDLNYDDASLKWIGSFTGDADSRFLVQIVDTAGNITTATNKGRYFQPGEVTASACSGKCVMLPIIIR